MCKWKAFYSGEEGYIVQCEECRYVQLGYGTLMITLSATEFSELTRMVEQRVETLVPFGDHRKSIVLPTPMACCQVLLTEAELAELHRMLQHADNNMQSDHLLRLFQLYSHR